MQPGAEEYNSVSRRPMDIEDYIDILRRHKAWIFGPAFAALVIAVVVAFLLPDTFVSEAVIRVVPPQVPENLVPSNINIEMSQRIGNMYQQISSRDNLAAIVTKYNLYPEERRQRPVEDVVESMRRDIRVSPVQSLGDHRRTSAFRVSFSYNNRYKARDVAQELVGRFMSEATRDLTNQSTQTTQFLNDQVVAAAKEVTEIEDRVTAFRTKFAGRLPDQLQSNQMRLSAMEQRIANLNSSISRVGQEKLLLETELRNAKEQMDSLTPPPEENAARAKDKRVDAFDRQIQSDEARLELLRQRYKDSYPDIQAAKSRIETLTQMRDRIKEEEAQLNAQAAESPEATPKRRYDGSLVREMQRVKGNIERLETQIKQKDMQAQEFSRSVSDAERSINSMQAALSTLPAEEQQYAELVRDRETAKQRYQELNRKRMMSSTAEDQRRRQLGENLELLDSPSLPIKPSKPKREMLVAMGAALGVVVGLLMVGAREAKDTSLKNLKDVRAYTQLTVLGSVPLLENDLVVRRRKRLAWLAWSTACLIGLMVMAGSMFFYYATKV